jgi:heme exporter protein A
MEIKARDLGKDFGEKPIFRDIGFDLREGQSLAIVGPNGSGKTTLVKILCGLIRPSTGSIQYFDNGGEIDRDHIFAHIGLVGPYLELYEDLTARENIHFFVRMRDLTGVRDKVDDLLEFFKLAGREDDAVKTYSSGMRQRLKYIVALLHDPKILFLDEPTSNLDRQGIERVYQVMAEQKSNRILLIATNDQEDLKYGDEQIAVGS